MHIYDDGKTWRLTRDITSIPKNLSCDVSARQDDSIDSNGEIIYLFEINNIVERTYLFYEMWCCFIKCLW